MNFRYLGRYYWIITWTMSLIVFWLFPNLFVAKHWNNAESSRLVFLIIILDVNPLWVVSSCTWRWNKLVVLRIVLLLIYFKIKKCLLCCLYILYTFILDGVLPINLWLRNHRILIGLSPSALHGIEALLPIRTVWFVTCSRKEAGTVEKKNILQHDLLKNLLIKFTVLPSYICLDFLTLTIDSYFC